MESSNTETASVVDPIEKIRIFLRRICFPFTLINLLIATALFFMYTAVAITNNAFNAYIIFLVFLILYILILYILISRNVIIVHTMFLSLILFMGFYNYLPLFIIKNASPNNYIALISSFFIVGAFFSYYYGYIKLINIVQVPVEGQPTLPDTDIIKAQNIKNPKASVLNYLTMTFLLTFVAAFTVDSIVFGSLGTSYFPNYVINSNIDVCSRPSKQSFKCNMYKDGKIVS